MRLGLVLMVTIACRSSSHDIASQAARRSPAGSAACAPKPLPAACPEQEPNVNRPCDAKALAGVECVYAPGCCPNPTYVCDDTGHFAARFETCP